MEYRSEGVEHVERFGPGELLRIPKGLEHRPVTNTGEVVSELTKSAERT